MIDRDLQRIAKTRRAVHNAKVVLRVDYTNMAHTYLLGTKEDQFFLVKTVTWVEVNAKMFDTFKVANITLLWAYTAFSVNHSSPSSLLILAACTARASF